MREQDSAWPEPESAESGWSRSSGWAQSPGWPEDSELELSGLRPAESAELGAESAGRPDLPAWPAEQSSPRHARPRRGKPSGGVWRSTEPDGPSSASSAVGAQRISGSAATGPDSAMSPEAEERAAGPADPAPEGAAATERSSTRGLGSARRGASGARRSGRDAAEGAGGTTRQRGTSRGRRNSGESAGGESAGRTDDSTVDESGAGRSSRKRSSRGGRAANATDPSGPDQTPEAVARDVVYRLLAVRARSRSELRQALLRKEIDEDVADAVLQKFVDANLVNDAEFAAAWVQERQRNQGLGRKALGYELRRKGVDEQLVAEALSTLDSDAEEERARELVRRKLRGTRADDPAKLLRRLVGVLARKGYSEGLAFRIAKEEIEAQDLGAAEDPDSP